MSKKDHKIDCKIDLNLILILQELAYTYKINPADFAEPWNATHYGVGLVPADPACGCGSFANDDDVEGNIALIGTDYNPCYLTYPLTVEHGLLLELARG